MTAALSECAPARGEVVSGALSFVPRRVIRRRPRPPLSFRVRYVRTAAGARRYGVPIGSPIPVGRRVRNRTLASGATRMRLTPAQRAVVARIFGEDSGPNGANHGGGVNLDVDNPQAAAAQLDRALNSEGLTPGQRRTVRVLRDKIRGLDRPAEEPSDAGPSPARAAPEPTSPEAQQRQSGVTPLGAGEVADDYRANITLSRQENRAIYRWTGTRASLINGYLRGLPGTMGGAEDAAIMENLAARYQLPGPAVGYRALGPDVIPDGDQTGQVITSPGFSAVALDRPAGGGFADPNAYPVMLEMSLPQGTSGIAVEATDHAVPDQREFVLPNNSRFVVGSERSEGGRRVLSVTVLPPEVRA